VVTPEMAKAGADVIAASGITDYPVEGVDTLTAAEIYRAMRRLAPLAD
jgi:ABC-type sugar transport system ATPase subunit